MSNSYYSTSTAGTLATLRQATGPGYQAAFNGHLLDLARGQHKTSAPSVKL